MEPVEFRCGRGPLKVFLEVVDDDRADGAQEVAFGGVVGAEVSALAQRGLKAQEQQEVVFGSYNESKIRHFWEHLYHWLEIGHTAVSLSPRPSADKA